MKLRPYRSSFVAAIGLGLSVATASAATIAHWNFDQGVAGQPFTNVESGGEAAIPDQSGNGYTMWAWNNQFGPSFSTDTPSGTGLSSRHNGGQDGYVFDTGLTTWSPLQWTIEVSVKVDAVDNGWRTFLGKDGSSVESPESDFYLQKSGVDDTFRVNFVTAGGERVAFNSNFVPVANQWYGLALVSDGVGVTLFADQLDGQGYQSVGSATYTSVITADNALAGGGHNWTFGRGWFNGGFGDHIVGNLDNIRFSDVALSPGELLAIPEPSTYALILGSVVLGVVAYRRRRRV